MFRSRPLPIQTRAGLLTAAVALASAGFCPQHLSAQTADPNATPPNPSSAPAAKDGTYAVSGGNLTAAPGLQVPNGNLPWALDSTADGKAALVPVHHSVIEEPNAVATAPPAVHTLQGAHARTSVRSSSPVFFIHANDRTENTGDAGHGNPTGWALMRAQLQAGNRVIPHVLFSQIAQGTSCEPPSLCLNAETLPDGWVRLTPRQPLERGEYVLLPVQRQPKPGAMIVYDFADDPAAPLAKDALVAGAAPGTRRKR